MKKIVKLAAPLFFALSVTAFAQDQNPPASNPPVGGTSAPSDNAPKKKEGKKKGAMKKKGKGKKKDDAAPKAQ